MADMLPITGKPHPKKFQLINGVYWHKKEVKRAKKTPGTALGDAEVAAAAAASVAASGAGGGGAAYTAVDAGEGNINPLYDPVPSSLSVEQRFQLCRSVAVECIQEEELRALLAVKAHPVCYDGFEPSGRMHIAQGILKALIVNKLTEAGCVFKFWVADWFAKLNKKLGGDLDKIRTTGRYMIEVWKAAGMNMSNVQFLWASDHINAHSDEYWGLVMDIATKNSLPRIMRCGKIMGRGESAEELAASQVFYPCMQCADIFYLKADICQLGLDQRKVNMLAREYCDAAEPKIATKPVVLSHGMLMGLKEGQEKMSKSDPDSAIFMEDSAGDVKRKIKKAYCPEGVVENNPVLDWCKNIVFRAQDSFTISRKAEFGGDQVFASYEALEAAFVAKELHPGDLKGALTAMLNGLLEPIRLHFSKGEPKALLEAVKGFRITR